MTITPKDESFIRMAAEAASNSRDPSTKVGCVLVRPDGTIASLGYNGAPRGVDDDKYMRGSRELKLAFVLHAEENAVLNCRDQSTNGYTAYVTMAPCSHCCSVLAQSGIRRVVCMPPKPTWLKSAELGRQMLVEMGVEVVWFG